MLITLRCVQPDDQPFLFTVYASTRMAELAQVPWTDEQRQAFLQMQFTAQSTHYHARYPKALHQIILLDGCPAGRLWADRQPDAVHILDVTVLPEYRGAGIGTAILRDLMAEAESQHKAVRIYVESYNPSLKLFERLGFSKTLENGVHWLMEWRPLIPGGEGIRHE